MSQYEKRSSGCLQAMIPTGGGILHQNLGDLDGVSFVLTSEEISYLLDLLRQYRSIISQATDASACESVEGPFDDMIASFTYQRAL